jgi:capsular exopolysaccharide synthesis family protein
MKPNYTKDLESIDDKRIHLREILEKYFFHWKWFVLCIIIAVIASFLYVLYTAPKYEVVSTVLIHHEEDQSISSELSAFKDLGIISGNNSIFATEIGVLQSRSLMEAVVQKLGINKMYYSEDKLRNNELYGSSLPIKLNFFGIDSTLYKRDTSFSIVLRSQTKFDLLDAENQIIGNHSFGENIASSLGNFTVTPSNTLPITLDYKIIVLIKPLAAITDAYRKKIILERLDKKSSLINLTLQDYNKQKARDILSNLVEEYNIEAIIDKSLIAENTYKFINERIKGISKELALLDSNTEDFKTSNSLTDIDSEARLILDSNNSLEKEMLAIATDLKLVDYMIEHINKNSSELIPSNLGLPNISLNQTTSLYNQILLERNRLLPSSNKINPVVINLENQLNNLRASISESLDNIKSSLSISFNDLKRQKNRLTSKINSVPKKERALKDIQRQQQIIETVYLYLLEKREENAISLAIKAPNAKIIDRAYGSDVPVAPRKLVILIASILLGVLVPALVIFTRSLFDYKIHTIEDIESVINIPILGDIPKTKKFNLLTTNDNKSQVMEALRIIRTNLYFILSKDKEVGKTIFVSSTIKGEGKSFTAINLAKILALSSKKVLLIGGDVRNPILSKYLDLPNEEGLTHYLADDSYAPESLIKQVELLNFDFLQGGSVPPNPSELLMNGRFDKLLSYSKEKYDYIIVDTAPISLVTDTVILSQDKADLFVYVVRADYLDKRMLRFPKKLYETKRIKNMAIILNSSNPKGSYGYGYGYSYGDSYGIEAKPWWKKLFS